MEQEHPPIPSDEAERLEALASFDIIDTAPEADLDDIVALLSQICSVPIATITFVDAHRQWFKAKVGLDLTETPRNVAFCAFTVAADRPLIIPDASRDARFADNPLVTGPPHLRFYAGLPLVTSTGSAVGTLAVMDVVPRQLELQQLLALQVMSRQVVKWLELRRSVVSKSRALDHAAVAVARNERLYRTLWETTTDAVLIIDRASVIRFASPSCTPLLGYHPTELVGMPLSLVQPRRFRRAHVAGMQRYLDSGLRRLDWRATEAAAVRKDGSECPVEIAFSEMDLDGDTHFVGFFRDITERRQSERLLFEEKERAQATLDAIGDGVVVVDEVGRVTFLNPVAEQITGFSAVEAIGRDQHEVLPLLDADGDPAFGPGPLPDAAEAPVQLMGKGLVLDRHGEQLSIEGSITRLRDRAGLRAGSVLVFRDVSKWRQLNAQLTHQATHDSLTGLVNRGELERRLQRMIDGSEPDGEHSMLYLDLDQFKVINDTCGHVAGDEMLRQLSALLRTQLRSRDTLARLGGDEFGVLLEHCPAEYALQVAEKLRSTVDEFPFIWGEHVFSVGVSIGHVSFSRAGMSLTDILSKADEACYLAKDLGRNRVHSYQPGDEELARRHGEMEWVALLRKALRENRFELHSQEIIDLRREGGPRHVELLLRMRDAAGALVPPMAYIPAAERYGLMPAIDRWVIATVCGIVGRRLKTGVDLRDAMFAINLSGVSLTDPSLPGYVRQQLLEHAVPGQLVCFEITETAAIGNLGAAVKLMEDLKTVGCRFSLDDFGSGMSSFAYLKRLPIDFLKIDGSFVRDIAVDPVDRAMVASINHIGHLMGLETIAEFVEDDATLQELKRIGVDHGQGFGLAHPVPFKD